MPGLAAHATDPRALRTSGRVRARGAEGACEPAGLTVLESALADETRMVPDAVRAMGAISLEQIARLTETIERLATELETASKTDPALPRLRTISGTGPVIAATVAGLPRISTRSTTDGPLPPGSASCHGNGPRAAR